MRSASMRAASSSQRLAGGSGRRSRQASSCARRARQGSQPPRWCSSVVEPAASISARKRLARRVSISAQVTIGLLGESGEQALERGLHAHADGSVGDAERLRELGGGAVEDDALDEERALLVGERL